MVILLKFLMNKLRKYGLFGNVFVKVELLNLKKLVGMDKVKDTLLVSFRVFKRIRYRELTGKRQRYFVLSVNGDEFYCNSFSGLILKKLIPLLCRDFIYPYDLLVKHGFIHDSSYRFRNKKLFVDNDILF